MSLWYTPRNAALAILSALRNLFLLQILRINRYNEAEQVYNL